ncbi:MAG: aromatic amino acid transport family protein [Candidatus Omnitrophota bacterium]
MPQNGQKIPFIKIFTNSLLVTGMTIGAGILALPIKTGMAGIVPSLVSMFLIWVLMLGTAMVFIYKFTHPKTRSRNYPTLFQNELGTKGRWVSVFGYLVNYYGILVAYLTGASTILATLVPINIPVNIWMLGFFVVLTGLALLGADKAKNANAFIMIAMIGAFGVLLFLSGSYIDVSRYNHKVWALMPTVMPIIIVAFAFHNVVPFLCKNLNGDQKASFKAVLIGSSMAIIINILWMFVVVGTLPLAGPGKATIISALQHDYPATIPLSLALNNKMITLTGMVFALAAIITSYIPTSVALRGFMRGIVSLHYKNPNKYVVLLLAYGPPFLVAMIYPDVFIKAVDIAGGFGILIVFGILPSLIMIKMAKNRGKLFKIAAGIMIICFSVLMAFEIAQETGFLKLDSSKEYWRLVYPHKESRITQNHQSIREPVLEK